MMTRSNVSVMEMTKCNKAYPSRYQRGVIITCPKRVYEQCLCKEHHYYLVKRFDKITT